MIVAVDIGNTNIVLGIFRNTKLLSERRFASAPVQTEAEYRVHLNQLCTDTSISARDLKGAVITSVVPHLTDALMIMVKNHLKLDPVIVTSDLDLGITIRYDDPKTLGADRICNTIAAFEKYGGPAIVVDLGTATTYDVISKEGNFLGGVIAPGIETIAAALHQITAQLPKIDLQFPPGIVGTNTVSSMQAGVLFGTIESMEGIIRRIKSVVGSGAVVVGTGGFVHIIAKHSNVFDYIEPSLVLEGARLIYKRVSLKNK